MTYEFRQFQFELKSPTVVLDDGLSLDRRPDALSLDYLTAFTLGPVHIGDSSLGAQERVWKVRSVGSQVMIARQTDDRSDFEAETLLFNYAAAPATELDVAFDQNANVLVCIESPGGPGGQGELLIYYFDPFAAHYQLVDFGRGRTPRAALDDPVSSNGDILVFYINDAAGICYRMQRDRYAVQYVVPDSQPVPDLGLGVKYGPVIFRWPGPVGGSYYFDGITGYTVQLGDAGGVHIQSTAHGMMPVVIDHGTFTETFIPETTAHVAAETVNIIDPPTHNTFVTLTFDQPITGIQIDAIGHVIDNPLDTGGAIIAYGPVYGQLLGTTIIPPHTTSEPNPQRGLWIRTGGIKYIQLNGSYWGRTTWENLLVRVDPPPFIPPLDPLLPVLSAVCLEDVYKSTDNRIHILYSTRNTVAGTYTLGIKATALYPFILPIEAWTMLTKPFFATLINTLLYVIRPGTVNPVGLPGDGFIDVEAWKNISPLPISGLLADIIIHHTLYDIDAFKMVNAVPVSGALAIVIILHTLYDVDTYKMVGPVPQSGSLVLVVIVHVLFDIDAFKMTGPLPIASGSSLV